jgi:hypothetical protein
LNRRLLQFADNGSKVRVRARFEFHEGRTNLDPLALPGNKPRDMARLRRGNFDDGLFGLDRDQRLVDDNVIAFGDMPLHDFSFLKPFAEVGEAEQRHW